MIPAERKEGKLHAGCNGFLGIVDDGLHAKNETGLEYLWGQFSLARCFDVGSAEATASETASAYAQGSS